MTETKPRARKRAAKKTPAKRAAAPRVTAVDRKIYRWRRTGLSVEAIATELKLTAAAVRAGFERAAADVAVGTESVRLLELDRLDRLVEALWDRATGEHIDPDSGTSVLDMEAVRQVAILSEARMRLAAGQLDRTGAGLVETATRDEVEALKLPDHTLAQTALVLARGVDQNQHRAGIAAAAARELRQTMVQLRGIAGASRTPADDDLPDNVTPPSRLDEVRRKAQERGGR